MNSPIILRISHISGIPHKQPAAITLIRDALLDHEIFENYLTPEQFSWLVNVRCSIRYRSTGISASWWLQHGSHEYTCSINDQLIACSDCVALQTGDRIEIGMIRLEVMDTKPTDVVYQTPVLPVTSHTAKECQVETETENDLIAEIPLLTEIITVADSVTTGIDHTDTDQAEIYADDMQHTPGTTPPYVVPVEIAEEDDILATLEQQFNTKTQHTYRTSSCQPTDIPSESISAFTTLDNDFSLSDLADLSHRISDDLSLEEALLGPLSIHQTLSELQTDNNEIATDISAITTIDFIAPHEETDVLTLFADTTVSPTNTSSTQHIHRSFPDSFCDISAETTSFELDDTLFQHKET